jgi:hypothetical protein
VGVGQLQQRSALSRPGRCADDRGLWHLMPNRAIRSSRDEPDQASVSSCRFLGVRHTGHYPVAGLQMNPYPIEVLR